MRLGSGAYAETLEASERPSPLGRVPERGREDVRRDDEEASGTCGECAKLLSELGRVDGYAEEADDESAGRVGGAAAELAAFRADSRAVAG